MKPRNPHAIALHSGIFQHKVIPNKKKVYNRKQKHKKVIFND